MSTDTPRSLLQYKRMPSSLSAAFLLLILLSHLSAQAQIPGEDRPRFDGGLSLAQAVQVGLRASLTVQAAQADVHAAAAETRAMRSAIQPQVSANTFLFYGDITDIVSSPETLSPPSYRTAPQNGFADQNLTLRVPLYTGGRLIGQVRVARERERAAAADVAGTQAETALRIRTAYYRVLLAAETIKSAEARLSAAKELVRITRAEFTAGKGLESAVRRVEAEQADAQRMLTTALNTRAKALLDLKVEMGVRLESQIQLTDTLTFTPPVGDLSAQLVKAGRDSPELRAARARLAAARHQTDSTRGSQGPQVYGLAMVDGLTSQPAGTRLGYSLGVVVSIPLVDGGLRRAENDLVHAREERSEADLRDLELHVAAEVQQAWLDVETAAQNYHTAQSTLDAAQSAYNVTQLRVQNQKGLLVELMDALATLTQAQGNIAQALYEHSLAVARLQRAVGAPLPAGPGPATSTSPENRASLREGQQASYRMASDERR